MTEERKIQLATEVDASGARQGFEEVKQGARDMAQSVAQSGQAAGKGLDAITDGAKRATDGTTRQLSSLRSSIQRAMLDIQTAGKSASEKFEIKADFKGIDRAAIQSDIAALRQLEDEQRKLQQAQQQAAPGVAFTDGLRAQLAALREQQIALQGGSEALLRYKAAQLGAADAEPIIAQIQAVKTALAEKAAADTQAAAAAKAEAAAVREQAAAQQTFLASLQDQRDRAVNASLSPADQARARAQQLGVSQQAEPLISQAAAAQVAQSQAQFLAGLQKQADAIGKTRSQLAAMQAAELGVAEAAAPMIAKLAEAEKGHHALGAGANFSTQQMQGLAHAARGVFDQIAVGQNPIRAVTVEMGRLTGTFGSVGGAFSAVTSLITPMRAAMVGAAAAVGGLALAMAHAETAARSLNTIQAQLAGTGRSDLFSTAELKTFIEQLSQLPGVSREAATSIVSELSKSHDIGAGLFKDLAGAAADYAKATGQKIPEAARELAKAFSDPAQGAKQLDEALSALSSSQLLQIERLTKMGDTAGAQRLLFQALEQSTKGLADNAMTPLQRSMNDLGNAWERTLQQLDKSEGLRTLNSLLAKTVEAVTYIVEHLDKIGGLGNLALAMVPGAAPSAVANAVRAQFQSTDPATATNGAQEAFRQAEISSVNGLAKAQDNAIKKTLEATTGYRSQAQQIADLTIARDRLTKSIKDSTAINGKDSDLTKELQGRLVGVNERIAQAKTKGGHEGQQVLDAQLQAQVKATQQALAQERDQLAFSQQYLQQVYAQGELSLKDFFEEKRKAIEQGAAAELTALEKERAAVEAHLAKTTDPSKRVQDQTRLGEIDAQEGKLRVDAARQTVLANGEEAASIKQLNEEVLNYRANLLQLQGDEVGAARIREQIANRQASILAKQSQGSGNPITQAQLDAYRAVLKQQTDLFDISKQSSIVNQQLRQQEDRLTLAQQTGAITTLDSLRQISQARAGAISQLEVQVQKMQELAAADRAAAALDPEHHPLNMQLQLDTSNARLQLDKLRAEIDPLKTEFDKTFRDAGSNLFADLMGGKGRDAFKTFLDSISKEINTVVGRELSEQLFGKDGALGGAGGFLADVFGGKDRAKAAGLDTSGVAQSLSTMQTAGIDPATSALQRLQQASDAAAGSIGARPALPSGIQDVNVAGQPVANVLTDATTGDFARLDRGQAPSGEQSVMDMFKDAGQSATDYAKSNAAASVAVQQLANAAGKGGGALSLLPAIVQAIQSAAASSSTTGGGSGSYLASLFSGSGGNSFTSSAPSGFEAASYAAYASGGYTGNHDSDKVAGVVHGNEYVFSAPAVRAIGLQRLERLHAKAKTGHMDEGDVPGYSDGGYVTVAGASRPVTMEGGNRYVIAVQPQPVKSGDTYVTHHHNYVTVNPTPGASRQTNLQTGRDVARGLEVSTRRNGR